jgi:hypothetical protein
MQDMKEEFNEDIEVLKKNQSEMNSSKSQIKIWTASLLNGVEQVKT